MALLLLALGFGCPNEARDQVETAATNIVLPPEDEAKLGQQVQQELSRQLAFVTDPRVTGYVGELTARIFAAARTEDPSLSVTVHVIDDPKTVNAFATLGSQLYVYSGLLMAANNEAELAGVLGHETGHIVARHPARQMVNEYGLSELSQLLLGKNTATLQALAASVASKGYVLANSRADETEADEYGALFASRAGYDPHALGRFLERISGGQSPSFLAFLSDHPMTPDRVSHLEAYIAQKGLKGQATGSSRLATVKQVLQAGGVGGGPRPGEKTR
jgi:predicted Zn-dependent protease